MNYILNIVKSKAFVLVTSIVALTISCTVTAFAYDVHSIYALPDVSVDSTFLGTLKAESVVVLDVSPRSSPFSASVLIDYDDLADLVYRSNQHGFNVSLEYRGNINKYVAYADDYKLFNRRVFGCLGNIKGSVYVAEPPDSGGSGSDTPSTDYSGNLSSIYNVLREISGRIVNGFNREYVYLDAINDNIVGFWTSVSSHLANASLDRQSIYSLLSVIDHKLDDLTDILDKMDSLSGDLTTLSDKMDVQTETLDNVVGKLTLIVSNTGSSATHLDHIEALQTKWLPALGDNIGTLVTKVQLVDTSVSNTLAEVMDVNTALTSIKDSASTAALKLDDIFYFLIDQNGPIYATPIIASKILAKLDDLHVTTDFSDTNIVGAINNLASLFSLGETKTIEVGGYIDVPRGSAQSVAVVCYADSGYVLFADGGFTIDGDTFSFSGVTLHAFEEYSSGHLGSFEISKDMNSLDGSIFDRAYDEVADVSIVLLDSSGTPIPLKTGDLIRPTATVGRWEVVRTTGEAIEIADCTGLPYGMSFGDILPRSALVPIHDLVAAPSLFTSYCDQVCTDGLTTCFVFNVSSQPLTVEYVNPSSLLNWYANRQNDFRYWLDTRLSNLPVGQSADVSALQATLTSLESTLSNTEYFAPVVTSVDAVGLNIENLNTSFNTNIGSLLDKLDIVIEGTSESVENRINVTIDASNDAHNVFYITGEDGEEQSVTEFTGDLTKASGRLLSLLYRLVFADALSTVDGDLDGFEDFFTSQGEETDTQSMESPYEEENVWLAS